VAPLRQLDATSAGADAWLFTPSPAYLFGGPVGGGSHGGANPPSGALVYYRLAKAPAEKDTVSLEFLDTTGKLIRRFTNHDTSEAGGGRGDDDGGRAGGAEKIPVKAGLNRFAWDMRYPDAHRFKGMILWGGGLEGPTVVPGEYQVRLTAGGRTQTRQFEVRKDPRLATTAADYQKRFDLHLKIRDKLSQTHDAITRLRDVRAQLGVVAEHARMAAPGDTAIPAAARVLSGKLTKVEETLYQTKNRSSQDPLNYPIRLNDKLSVLTGVVDAADAAPTEQSVAVYDQLAGQIDAELAKLDQLLGDDLAAFNRLVREKELPAVVVKGKS
jgi:predicted flap endonuclease-1-like 5' DNA nuclease